MAKSEVFATNLLKMVAAELHWLVLRERRARSFLKELCCAFSGGKDPCRSNGG
jgi:hypothetical protein